ncbi:MAG: biotin transporter BioY [Firmicutes bacterium]|nr:biotin transporter BioY [Bacillota bacterium]
MRDHHLRTLALAGLFAGLTAAAAQITFRLPVTGVPFTLQVLAVLLSGSLLGPVGGAAAQAVYLLLGAAGAPVFAEYSGGLARLVGPTGGFLMSYPIAALVVGWLADPHRRPGLGRTLAAMLAGLAVIYAGGAGWAILAMGRGPGEVLTKWVLVFVPYDLLKVALAAALSRRVLAALAAAGQGPQVSGREEPAGSWSAARGLRR